MTLVMAALLTGCFVSGDNAGRDPSETTGIEVPTGERLADDGYAGLTLELGRAEIVQRYSGTRFDPLSQQGNCAVLRPANVPDIELTFVSDRLVRVDVVGTEVSTINAGHRVGDRFDDVVSSYEAREANGEGVQIVEYAPDRLVVSAREQFRLVFEASTEHLIARMYGTLPGFIGEGRCGGDHLVPPELTLDAFVPASVLGVALRVRDPKLEDLGGTNNDQEDLPGFLTQKLFDSAWSLLTGKWKAFRALDYANKALSCLYEIDAAAVGVYLGEAGGGPRLVLIGALNERRAVSVDLAICLAKKSLPFPASEGPEHDIKACADGYRTRSGKTHFLVGYAVVGQFEAGTQPCTRRLRRTTQLRGNGETISNGSSSECWIETPTARPSMYLGMTL